MKLYLLIPLLFCVIITNAQNKLYNSFSADINYGLSLPVTPIPEGRKAGDFTSFNHISVGVRYMIIPEVGIKLSYGHEKFHDKKNKDNNLVNNSFNLQAVSNLVYLFGFEDDFWQSAGMLAHAGGGITSANPTGASNNEKIGNLIFGLTPLYRLNDKFAISTDFSYVVAIKQQFGFDGQLIEPDFDPTKGFKAFTGGIVNITVGLKYYIGKNKDHADWQ